MCHTLFVRISIYVCVKTILANSSLRAAQTLIIVLCVSLAVKCACEAAVSKTENLENREMSG